MSISRDVQYMKLSNELRDLKAKKEKTRPMMYFLLLIVLVLGGLFFTGWVAFACWFFAVAAPGVTGAPGRVAKSLAYRHCR
jgi:hypothetical protein